MSERGSSEYHDGFVAGLEWMWGEGWLSPGGPVEVAAILEGISIRGKRVLDVGCGLGGVDVELVLAHGAAEVVGIDIEPRLLERARVLVARHGLEERITLREVDPGPFDEADASFDVVFSKDSMVHIPDKQALYAEVLRVLRPGGMFLASDWLRGDYVEESPAMREWLDTVHLSFDLATPEQTEAAMRRAGFRRVRVCDRNAWYRDEVRREVESVSGDKGEKLAQKVGREVAAHRQQSSRTKLLVVESGELRPCHLVGYKPE